MVWLYVARLYVAVNELLIHEASISSMTHCCVQT